MMYIFFTKMFLVALEDKPWNGRQSEQLSTEETNYYVFVQ